MQNASKPQLTLPVPASSGLLLFVLAFLIAGVLAYLQNRQITQQGRQNVEFRTSTKNLVSSNSEKLYDPIISYR